MVTIVKTCPECGGRLVVRVNRATREPFLGCERYPGCEYSEPMPEVIRMRRAGAPMLPFIE